MALTRRLLLLSSALLLAACAAPPPAVDPILRNALAPTGTLRVGVYPGSPTSLVQAADGTPAGVAHDLGQLLGREIGVPVQLVRFDRVAQVVDALKAGQVDFTFTNASEQRARDVDFSYPLVRLELGYLVPPGSTATAVADLDQPGRRIGVTQGSTSQTNLPRALKAATVVPVPSMAELREQLRAGRIDAFATNKGILFEQAGQVPGSRVLDGRWGIEQLAMAIPKGRDPAAVAYLSHLGEGLRADGRLARIAERAGLRGLARD